MENYIVRAKAPTISLRSDQRLGRKKDEADLQLLWLYREVRSLHSSFGNKDFHTQRKRLSEKAIAYAS